MKEKEEYIDSDEGFSLFYSTVFIAFSIGIYLQSEVPNLRNHLWVFVVIGMGLLIWFTIKRRKK